MYIYTVYEDNSRLEYRWTLLSPRACVIIFNYLTCFTSPWRKFKYFSFSINATKSKQSSLPDENCIILNAYWTGSHFWAHCNNMQINMGCIIYFCSISRLGVWSMIYPDTFSEVIELLINEHYSTPVCVWYQLIIWIVFIRRWQWLTEEVYLFTSVFKAI